MENDSGIICLRDERININRMKELYIEEYRKILNAEAETNKNYVKNKWKVRLGALACEIGLTFANGKHKILNFLGVGIAKRVTGCILKYKNKRTQKRYKAEEEKLTADFINGEGIFKQFSVINNSSIEIINYGDDKSKKFHR